MDVPAGWYPDPASSSSARWWDGAAWTDRTIPLDELLAPQTPAYAAPTTDTLVLPGSSASPELVPPFAPVDPSAADTAVYPLGPTYDDAAPDGQAAAPAPRTRSVGWPVIAVIGVVALALVVAAVLAVRALGPGSGRPAASSPSGSGSSAAPPASGSPGGSGAGAVGAVEAGRVLETFKPSQLPSGVTATLIPQGDVAAGQKTLDGWCSSSYETEKDRIARRQWALTEGGQDIGLSVEAVAYATPEQAAAALQEFRDKTDACHGVVVDEDGTAVTQDVVSAAEMTGLPAGITGYRATMTVAGTSTDGTAFTGSSTSTVQRKGQYVTIVWTNQSTPISAGDRRVIDQFVAEQTAALAATS